MFDGKLRDKLLFEDQYFTYIRRYFWAYNTLGVINNGIRAMRASYEHHFTSEFWDGKHNILWPHPSPDSADGQAYRAKMAVLRQELEKALMQLDIVKAKNEDTRKEIEKLREQLFAGSSIFESRRAIEQGDNIKILTLSTMIFLPLTFVTVSTPFSIAFPPVGAQAEPSKVRLRYHRVGDLHLRLALRRNNGLRLRALHNHAHHLTIAHGLRRDEEARALGQTSHAARRSEAHRFRDQRREELAEECYRCERWQWQG
jgi:hypothetical protein